MDYDAARYRELAEQCRLLAKGTQTTEARQSLIDMADDFDAEAERLQELTMQLPPQPEQS